MHDVYACVKCFDANIALFAWWQPDMCVVILTSLWLVEQLNLTKRGKKCDWEKNNSTAAKPLNLSRKLILENIK